MFAYQTKEGKPLYIAELCFFDENTPPFLKVDENSYLATTPQLIEGYPTVSYIFISLNREPQTYRWTILPVIIRTSAQPIKTLFVQVSKEEIENLLLNSP